MARGLKITSTDISGQIHDKLTGPESINGAYVGGTGGLTSQVGRQIQPTVFLTGGSQTSGSILAQKGRKSFRVTDGTRTGDATLTNSGSLAAGQMNILLTLSTITSASIAAYTGGTAGFTYITYTPSNVTGPVATPRVGDFITGFTGNGTAVMVTGVVAAGNVQVSVVGNVSLQTGVTVTDNCYASRITNRTVYDFGTDGVPTAGAINGSVTYNPNRFRYHLAAPDSTFIQVAYA